MQTCDIKMLTKLNIERLNCKPEATLSLCCSKVFVMRTSEAQQPPVVCSFVIM